MICTTLSTFSSTPDFGGYDQFGSLLGQVFIDDRNLSLRTETTEMTTYEFNLPGIRQRRCLPFNSENQRRYAYIYGVCHDGTIFVIGASSYDESMSQLRNYFFEILDSIFNSLLVLIHEQPSIWIYSNVERENALN